MNQHEKALTKLVAETAYRHNAWDIFRDFLEMGSIAFSNAVDLGQRVKREAEYMKIVMKYERKDLERFPMMLAELTMAMEEDPGDILGRVFQELGIANKWTGQFFTPDSVSRLMSEMMIDDMKQEIKEKGFITVNEPAIGGGGLIINLALALKAAGINYQQSICVTGVDIDIKSIHMSYLQLTLLHIPAVLIHGNSLTLQEHSRWYTPSYMMGGWVFKKQRETPTKTITLPSPKKRKSEYETISLFEVI